MSGVRFPRVLAVAVSCGLVLSQVPATSAAVSSVGGHVLAASDNSPVPGARVHLGDPRTGKLVSSAPASADGSFVVADVPPGAYQVGVESKGRLYVVDAPLQLAAGKQRTLNLQVRQDAQPTTGEDRDKPSGAMSVWDNPLTASLIVVGGAIGVGLIINALQDDETQTQSVSPATSN